MLSSKVILVTRPKLHFTILVATTQNMSSRRRKCKNDPDNFCYICGQYTPPMHRRKHIPKVKTAYKFYFGCEVGDQDQSWSPHISCNACNTQLLRWLAGKKKKMPYGIPMVWREQADHTTDCYFCLTDIKGFSRKNKSKIKYPDCRSAMKPVPHSSEVPFHHHLQLVPWMKMLRLLNLKVQVKLVKVKCV